MEFKLTDSTDMELIAVPYRLTIVDSGMSISKEWSNEVLRRLRDKGFTTLYGELLRVTEEHLSVIPFRPQIENTGCEVAKRVDRPEWLLMWQVRRPKSWQAIEHSADSSGSTVDVIHLVRDGVVPTFDRSTIADLFGVPMAECNEGIWEQEWNIGDLDQRPYAQHERGQLLNTVEGRRILHDQIGRGALNSESAGGIELELCVAEALHDVGWQFRSGVETPFGELDHIAAILDSLVLIECKNTKSIGMKDIQVLVSRAASIDAEYAFLFTTMSSADLHSNVREALKQFRRSGSVYVMVLFIRDLGEHVKHWVSEISSMIGHAMIDHWIMAEESHYRRSPLWRIDGDGRINGFDGDALSKFSTEELSVDRSRGSWELT